MQNRNHVVISGGSSGLGLGIALRYLEQGAAVSILDLTRPSEEVQAQLNQAAGAGGKWAFCTTDITDFDQAREAVSEAVLQNGPLVLAVNSAGIGFCQSFEDTSVEAFAQVIDVNLKGSFVFSKAVIPQMEQGSRLVLIASLAGLVSNYGYSAYGASKFGVVGLATTLRYEYEARGIHVTCVCPPEVKTPLVEKERQNGNPISLELKTIAGSMGVDEACDKIVAGIKQGRTLVIPGASAKATALAWRLVPGVFHLVMQTLIRRVIKKHRARDRA